MSTDLHLSVTDTSTKPPTVDTSRLSWATSLFYFGMLAGLYPMTFLLQRFKQSYVLTPIIVIWGAMCMATAGVTTYRGLYAQRFFLGFVEAVLPTCFSTIVTSFYTQDEQALRQSWWWSSLGFWVIIGGSINYGFGQIHGGALARWQYLYLFAGSLTIVIGLACFWMPDSPVTAWFLTEEERVVAVERLRSSQTGVRCHVIKMPQVLEALRDVKVLLVFIMMGSAYTINGAVSGFGPLIVSTFGYTPLESILLQFPLGGLCVFSTILTGYLASKIPNIRILMLIICCLPVIAGCAMIWRSTWSHRPATPVAGYSITGVFGAVVGLIISVGMSNVAGATKKSFMAAAIFVAYCVGNIVGPQLIKSQTKARHYPELWLGLIIWYVRCVEHCLLTCRG